MDAKSMKPVICGLACSNPHKTASRDQIEPTDRVSQISAANGFEVDGFWRGRV